MTSDQQAFMDTIRKYQDDPAPRLVYADYVDEGGDSDRAEFIRLGCKLQQLKEEDEDYKKDWERWRELLALHNKKWFGELDTSFAFCDMVLKGFPEKLYVAGTPRLIEDYRRINDTRIPMEDFTSYLTNALNLFPITSLSVDFFNGQQAAYLAAMPELAQIETLNIRGMDDEQAISTLLSSPYLSGLKNLKFENSHACNIHILYPEDIQAILSNPSLQGLQNIYIHAVGFEHQREMAGDRYLFRLTDRMFTALQNLCTSHNTTKISIIYPLHHMSHTQQQELRNMTTRNKNIVLDGL